MTARRWLASHRPRTRYARVRAELAALDRGIVECGLIAAQAIERGDRCNAEIRALYRTMERACEAAGLPVDDKPPRPRLSVLGGGDAS